MITYFEGIHFSKFFSKLKHINELQKIKDLKLKELILDANPLCDSFSDQAKYVRYVPDNVKISPRQS